MLNRIFVALLGVLLYSTAIAGNTHQFPQGQMQDWIAFDFCSGYNYTIANRSWFTLQIDIGHANERSHTSKVLAADGTATLRNKLKRGDWYAINYSEQLHFMDLTKYKRAIHSVFEEVGLSNFATQLSQLYVDLLPDQKTVTTFDFYEQEWVQKRVDNTFKKFLLTEGINVFAVYQQQEALRQIQLFLSLMVQSKALYLQSETLNATQYPVADQPGFTPGSKGKLSPNVFIKGGVSVLLYDNEKKFDDFWLPRPNFQAYLEIGLPFENKQGSGSGLGIIRPYLCLGYHQEAFQLNTAGNYFLSGSFIEQGESSVQYPLNTHEGIEFKNESFRL